MVNPDDLSKIDNARKISVFNANNISVDVNSTINTMVNAF
jgi:hypothetical protein